MKSIAALLTVFLSAVLATACITSGFAQAPAPAATPRPLPITADSTSRLSDPLAARIAKAIADGTCKPTESSKEPGGGTETPKEGAVLVGFEFLLDQTGGKPDVRSLRPVYLTAKGTVKGEDRGQLEKVSGRVVARPGYAVATLVTWHNERRIAGMQVIFGKLDQNTGKLDLTPQNSYESKWLGTKPRNEPTKKLGGDGRLAVGVFGNRGSDADTIGLIQMPPAAAP